MGKDTVFCMNYKGKEVEGCELKLNRLTADKKQLPEIQAVAAQRNWFNYFISLFRTEFFQCPDAFKNGRWGWGCIFKEDSQQNHWPAKPMCYHYCFYSLHGQAA